MPRRKTTNESRIWLSHAKDALLSRSSALSSLYAAIVVCSAVTSVLGLSLVAAVAFDDVATVALALLLLPLALLGYALHVFLRLHVTAFETNQTDALRSESYLIRAQELAIQAKNASFEVDDPVDVQDPLPPTVRKRIIAQEKVTGVDEKPRPVTIEAISAQKAERELE